ncbi:murein biosynthesis integral membrane protein MurJ [Castellaniella sp.]|uniref:murein biosynthesis integral membrane protein MurJ n=1 Tax=Castellaniella sp. TaxID=1955812 RepID=UPI00355EA458
MGLLRSAATVSSLTFVSRISGMLRDVIIASLFGAGAITDAFWVAFRIPNLLRRLFAEGAFSQAFVPILGEVHARGSRQALHRLLDRVAVLLFLTLCAVTLAGMLAAPWVVTAIATGLREASRAEEFSEAIWMTRLMFPYIICMSLVAFASGVLNTFSRFAVPALTPVLLNISMMATSLLLAQHVEQPIHALAIGVIVGGLLQFGVQWAALARLGLLPRPVGILEAWRDSTVHRIMRQMVPAILGVSVAQLSLLINTNIATWLAPGSVTWLSFADRLMEFPTALLGVALGTVLLPTLSAAHARQDHDAYNALLDWGLRLVLLLGIPAALGLALLADGLVATLFNYGAFTATDVAQTRVAVMAYAVGLLGLLAIKILAPGFYAKQDIRTPVRIAIFVLIFTQLMNLAFVPWLAHAGLALSIGLGASVNALSLVVLLRRRKLYQPQAGWPRFMLRMLPALLAMVGFLLWVQTQFDWIALGATPLHRAAWLLLVVVAAALIYFALLITCGFRLRDFTRKPV